MSLLTTFAQTTVRTMEVQTTTVGEAAGLGAFMLVLFFSWLAILAVMVIAYWKIFTKAGKPGWASIIPIYNTYVLLQIAGRPVWWLLLMLIPFVNIVVWLFVALDIAKAFGKDELFAVLLLWFFTPIGALILAFGDATYHGVAATTDQPAAPLTPPTPPTTPAA